LGRTAYPSGERSSEHRDVRAVAREARAVQRVQRDGGEGRRGRQHQCQPEGEQSERFDDMAATQPPG
jgi:hypothetical protein